MLFEKCNEDKRTGTLGVRCNTNGFEMFLYLYLSYLLINPIYFSI